MAQARSNVTREHPGDLVGHGIAEIFASHPTITVLRLALPTTAVMLVAALSNVLYTYYISRLGSEALAALALVFPLSLIALTAFGGALGTGTASAVARALGARKLQEAASVALHAALLSLAVGLAFTLLVYVGARSLFTLLGARGDVLDQATTFARWLFAGSAIGFLNQVLDSSLRAEANARTPAVWTTASLFLQMALTPLFMFVLHLGLVGAALGMTAAQALTLIPRLLYLSRGHSSLSIFQVGAHWSAQHVREVLRVGLPASVSTTIHYVALMALTGIVAHFGHQPLAAYGLGTRLDFLLLSVAFGFSSAVLTLVGLAVGAREPRLAWRFVYSAAACVSAVLLLTGVGFFFQPEAWLGLFTEDQVVLHGGALYLRFVALSYPFLGVSMVCSFAFQALGRATVPMIWSIVRASTLIALGLIEVHWLQWSVAGLFGTIAASNVLSALVLGALLYRTFQGEDGPGDPSRKTQ